MKIQSVLIDVPGSCPNNCKFCVSELTKEQATGMLENIVKEIEDPWVNIQYAERLEFLRDLGATTAVLTGTASEPIANIDFIEWFHQVNQSIMSPFKHIEIQTSGVMIDSKTLDRLDSCGVKTVSLSLASLDSNLNNEISGIPERLQYDITDLCHRIKASGFNLRLSLNVNYKGFPFAGQIASGNTNYIKLLFDEVKRNKADQVTFRRLYSDGSNTPQAKWIVENDVPESVWSVLKNYIRANGKPLQKLPFGAIKYSVHHISTVVDADSIVENSLEVLKYAILRRNCKIYSDWEDPASLIF